MATQAQIEANRRNGRKGGVKTKEGKMRSRQNARKHGIFANALTREDKEDVVAIYEELRDRFNPATAVEGILVDKMAVTVLRMQRCARMEAIWLEEAPIPFDECLVTEQTDWDALTLEERHQRRAEQERRRTRRRVRPEFGDGAPVEVAGRWLDQVKLLNRYDTTLTNQFLKLLHELQNLQAMRCGRDAALPMLTPEPAADQDEAPAGTDVAASDDAASSGGAAALRNEPNSEGAADAAPVCPEQHAGAEAPALRNVPNPVMAGAARPENEEFSASSASALQNEPNPA